MEIVNRLQSVHLKLKMLGNFLFVNFFCEPPPKPFCEPHIF